MLLRIQSIHTIVPFGSTLPLNSPQTAIAAKSPAEAVGQTLQVVSLVSRGPARTGWRVDRPGGRRTRP